MGERCPKCDDTGWLWLPKQNSRMTWHKPCDCPVGRERAQAVADFVNQNPPDAILRELEQP